MGMKKADPQFCRTGFSGILFEGNSAIVNGADVSCRVLPNSIDTHFEVTMVSVSITGGTDCRNQLTLFYPFANLDINLAVVCVKGLNSAAMVNNYISAIGAVGVIEGRYNGTRCRSTHRCAHLGCDVHTAMVIIAIEAAGQVSVSYTHLTLPTIA